MENPTKQQVIDALETSVKKRRWGKSNTCPLCKLFIVKDEMTFAEERRCCNRCARATKLFKPEGICNCGRFDAKHKKDPHIQAGHYFNKCNGRKTGIDNKSFAAWRKSANIRIRERIEQLKGEING